MFTAAGSTEGAKMSTSMSGLRVYINAPGPDQPSSVAVEDDDLSVNRDFYSRRGNGPIYRWRYEEKLAHWRASRMQTSDFETQKLSNATWKSVPETLQAQLGSHYLD
jgi:hypothetical protein